MKCKNEVLAIQLLQIPHDLHRDRAAFFPCSVLSSWLLFILEEMLVFQ